MCHLQLALRDFTARAVHPSYLLPRRTGKGCTLAEFFWGLHTTQSHWDALAHRSWHTCEGALKLRHLTCCVYALPCNVPDAVPLKALPHDLIIYSPHTEVLLQRVAEHWSLPMLFVSPGEDCL